MCLLFTVIIQDLQDTWAASRVTTLVKCINDKSESVLQVVRKAVDEIKEERAIH